MYIYKITIQINDDELYYIGKCESGKLDYTGSGKILKRYFSKYGKDILKNKEILFETQDRIELAEAERSLIKENNAVNDKKFLNLTHGGDGGNTFLAKTKEEVDQIIQKRRKTIAADSSISTRQVNNFKNTINLPEVKNRIKQSMAKCQPQRIETYKQTVHSRTPEQKLQLSKILSKSQIIHQKSLTDEQKQQRQQKELMTKSLRTPEQKASESALKSIASIKAAQNRTEEDWKEFGQKVSKGIKKYKDTLTQSEKNKIIETYRNTMYTKNGMLQYKNEIILMFDNSTSYDIFCFLRSKGIPTHHSCVKRFIDFIKTSLHISTQNDITNA